MLAEVLNSLFIFHFSPGPFLYYDVEKEGARPVLCRKPRSGWVVFSFEYGGNPNLQSSSEVMVNK
jgi:hypothetical protein